MRDWTFCGIQALKGFFGALLVNLPGGYTKALVYYHKKEPISIHYYKGVE